jgi:hypothetical protein
MTNRRAIRRLDLRWLLQRADCFQHFGGRQWRHNVDRHQHRSGLGSANAAVSQ